MSHPILDACRSASILEVTKSEIITPLRYPHGDPVCVWLESDDQTRLSDLGTLTDVMLDRDIDPSEWASDIRRWGRSQAIELRHGMITRLKHGMITRPVRPDPGVEDVLQFAQFLSEIARVIQYEAGS